MDCDTAEKSDETVENSDLTAEKESAETDESIDNLPKLNAEIPNEQNTEIEVQTDQEAVKNIAESSDEPVLEISTVSGNVDIDMVDETAKDDEECSKNVVRGL